jgi:uncharacterized protein YjiS (DUF1127 family)
MDSSRRAIWISDLGTRRETWSRGQSFSRGRIHEPIWGMFWRWCIRCSARSRQRQALSSLDDRLLEDIGVTRQEADVEAAKPFWK